MSNTDLIKQLAFSYYGLHVYDIGKVRDAWRLETNAGPKCLKQVDTSSDKVRFLAAAVQHIINTGFEQTVPFNQTITGQKFLDLPIGIFYLTDWITGREGNFSHIEDVINASVALARFHKASKGFNPPPGSTNKEAWGRLPKEWLRHKEELCRFRNTFKNADTPFHHLYLEHCDSYIERCNQASIILENCNYENLTQKSRNKGCLCHRDFTYHNFIVDEQGKLYIIDFDYCTQDLRVCDLGRYCRKIAKSSKWQMAPVKSALKAYDREDPLSPDEFTFILAYLIYPQRFWRLAKRYFVNPSSESSQTLVKQLQAETALQKAEQRFLQELSFEISRGLITRR